MLLGVEDAMGYQASAANPVVNLDRCLTSSGSCAFPISVPRLHDQGLAGMAVTESREILIKRHADDGITVPGTTQQQVQHGQAPFLLGGFPTTSSLTT